MVSFAMPVVFDNESGWGPAPDACPDHLRHLPFVPFSKNEKLGRACEWSQTRERDKRSWQRNRGQEESSPFNYEQVDEEGFHLVEKQQTTKPKWGPGGRRGPFQLGRGGRGGFGGRDGWQDRGRDGQSAQKGDRFTNQKDARSRFGARGGRGGGRGFDSWRDKPQRVRVSSVEVKSDWMPLDGSNTTEDFTMSLTQMEKLRVDEDPVAEDVAMVGSLFLVDKSIDKASVRSTIPLRKMAEPKPIHVAIIDDPVIKKLASQNKGNIFTTDIALAVLMAAPRSVNSWDMVVQRSGSSLFLDIRDGCSIYDTTVNETAVDAPDDEQKDSINSMSALCTEAGYINYCFNQQCLDKKQVPVPTDTGDKAVRDTWHQGTKDQLPPGKSFRYRRWQLSDDLTLVVRCEVDAALHTRDASLAYITIKALNEFDSKISGIDWRQKLESQRAAVLANELKNNRNKLARWTCQALIAGADYMKVGFVSRHHAKDHQSHFVLGQQLYKPEEFAKQIELKTDNCWGIVLSVMTRLMELPAPTSDDAGNMKQYLMLKDPNKPLLNLYNVPADAFDYEAENDDNENQAGRDDDHDSDFE